jgi:nitrate reductase assembly molybdenum cofactor insertion protein NarJ
MQIYPLASRLFTYPSGDYQDVISQFGAALNPYGEGVLDGFRLIDRHFTGLPVSELQEYYIRTFDVNADCYLDIGYVLFGEESKRGQFLLNMKSEQLKANNPCGTEFADHLPNVLTLLPKMEDPLIREELVVALLVPALKHMAGNFRTGENTYLQLLNILIHVLETDYSGSLFEPFTINQEEIECASAYSCGMEFTKNKSRKH